MQRGGGEDGAGRWALLLAGPTSPRRATLEAPLALAVALLAPTLIEAGLNATAPAGKPDWGTGAIIVLLGVAAALIGVILFLRRDDAYA